MVGGLLGTLLSYHTNIIIMNETTQENMRDKYRKWGSNPYNLGFRTNFLYFWT